MFGETICKIVGFIVFILIGIYFIRKVMNYELNTIEGFVEKEIASVKKEVEKFIEKKKTKLKINDDSRPHYEDMLKYLDTIIGAEILIKITEQATAIAKKPSDSKNLIFMEKINTMTSFKDALNKNLNEWLDARGDFN